MRGAHLITAIVKRCGVMLSKYILLAPRNLTAYKLFRICGIPVRRRKFGLQFFNLFRNSSINLIIALSDNIVRPAKFRVQNKPTINKHFRRDNVRLIFPVELENIPVR